MVTVVLSGIPQNVTLKDLAYHLDRFFTRDYIKDFHVRDLPKHPKTGKRRVALDFRSGFDGAMDAQNVLDGHKYTMDDGREYTLKAKINHDPELARKTSFFPEPSYDTALVQYQSMQGRSHTSNRLNADSDSSEEQKRRRKHKKAKKKKKRRRRSSSSEESVLNADSDSSEEQKRRRKHKKDKKKKRRKRSPSSEESVSSSNGSVDPPVVKKRKRSLSPTPDLHYPSHRKERHYRCPTDSSRSSSPQRTTERSPKSRHRSSKRHRSRSSRHRSPSEMSWRYDEDTPSTSYRAQLMGATDYCRRSESPPRYEREDSSFVSRSNQGREEGSAAYGYESCKVQELRDDFDIAGLDEILEDVPKDADTDASEEEAEGITLINARITFHIQKPREKSEESEENQSKTDKNKNEKHTSRMAIEEVKIKKEPEERKERAKKKDYSDIRDSMPKPMRVYSKDIKKEQTDEEKDDSNCKENRNPAKKQRGDTTQLMVPFKPKMEPDGDVVILEEEKPTVNLTSAGIGKLSPPSSTTERTVFLEPRSDASLPEFKLGISSQLDVTIKQDPGEIKQELEASDIGELRCNSPAIQIYQLLSSDPEGQTNNKNNANAVTEPKVEAQPAVKTEVEEREESIAEIARYVETMTTVVEREESIAEIARYVETMTTVVAVSDEEMD